MKKVVIIKKIVIIENSCNEKVVVIEKDCNEKIVMIKNFVLVIR